MYHSHYYTVSLPEDVYHHERLAGGTARSNQWTRYKNNLSEHDFSQRQPWESIEAFLLPSVTDTLGHIQRTGVTRDRHLVASRDVRSRSRLRDCNHNEKADFGIQNSAGFLTAFKYCAWNYVKEVDLNEYLTVINNSGVLLPPFIYKYTLINF